MRASLVVFCAVTVLAVPAFSQDAGDVTARESVLEAQDRRFEDLVSQTPDVVAVPAPVLTRPELTLPVSPPPPQRGPGFAIPVPEPILPEPRFGIPTPPRDIPDAPRADRRFAPEIQYSGGTDAARQSLEQYTALYKPFEDIEPPSEPGAWSQSSSTDIPIRNSPLRGRPDRCAYADMLMAQQYYRIDETTPDDANFPPTEFGESVDAAIERAQVQAVADRITALIDPVTDEFSPDRLALEIAVTEFAADPLMVAATLGRVSDLLPLADVAKAAELVSAGWNDRDRDLLYELLPTATERGICPNAGEPSLGVRHLFGMEREGREIAVLADNYYYCFPPTGALYEIPVSYETDFLSIPELARWVFRSRDFLVPALVHDWLYSVGESDKRLEADQIFRYALREYGAPYGVRESMYFAVRIGGDDAFGAEREWRFRELGSFEPMDSPPERPETAVIDHIDCDNLYAELEARGLR